MSLFNLWNFYRLSPKDIEVDVTAANMPGINQGSNEWVAKAVHVFSRDVAIASWSLLPFRSFYFTDYPDRAEWEDRWPKGWLLHVVLAEEVAGSNKFLDTAEDFNEADPTWEYGFVSPDHNRNALIVCDTPKTFDETERTAQDIANQATQQLSGEIKLESQIRTFGNKSQLRLFLRGVNFPEAATSLEKLLDFCRSQGGAVNWRSKL